MDKYGYLTLQTKFDHHIRIGYSRTEEVERGAKSGTRLYATAWKCWGLGKNRDHLTRRHSFQGQRAGLVQFVYRGLLNGLYAYQGRHVSPQVLAEQACHVEIDLCGDPIGKQDQFAAAFGDLRMYHFHPDGSVKVEPLICRNQTLEQLQRNLLMFYTGITRSAAEILKEQAQVWVNNARRLRRCIAWWSSHGLRRELEAATRTGWVRFCTKAGC